MTHAQIKILNFKDNFRALLVGALTLVTIGAGSAWQTMQYNQVLGVQDTVTVGASVEACFFRIKVYPEKRIPATGNWGTDLVVDMYRSNGTHLLTFNTTTNDAGGLTPQIDICNLLSAQPVGQYILRVKGLSHLRNRFPATTLFDSSESVADLTQLEPPLFAGETSIVFDNFINGLDLSTQVHELYTDDNKNDLNQDGIVNSLDLSNTIFNLYRAGDN